MMVTTQTTYSPTGKLVELTRPVMIYTRYTIDGKTVFGLRGPILEIPNKTICLIVDFDSDVTTNRWYVEVMCDECIGWIPATTHNYKEIVLT